MKRTPLARKTPIKPRAPANTRKGRINRMTKLRKMAQGRECQVRLPGVCIGGTETTVLAHYRLGTGGGQKPDDQQGAWACHACHDVCDGRVPRPDGMTYEYVRLAHAEGVLRTQEASRDAA